MNFRLGQSTISGIIKDTCHALRLILQESYLNIPNSEEEWKVVAYDFAEKWNFPHCRIAAVLPHWEPWSAKLPH